MRVLRVMLFVHALNDRAIADIVCCLADEMAEFGHDVVVVAASVSKDASRLPGRATMRNLGHHRGGTLWSVPRLRGAINAHEPDVVFAHGDGATRAAVAATMGMGAPPPVVGIMHNHYSSYLGRYRRQKNLVSAFLLPKAHRVVGVAPEIIDDLERVFPRLRGRTAVVPEPMTRWVHLAQMAEEPADHPDFPTASRLVVSVANVHLRKDPETLVRAIIEANQRSNDPVFLAIIGRIFDRGLGDHLKDLAREAGLADQVRLLGFVANPFPYVRRAAVFALTSRNEGLPVCLLEAMALGVPLVSTDCPSGPSFLTERGRCGVLVPVGDHRAAAAAIVELLDDEARRARLSEAGLERVREFTPTRVAAEHLSLLARSGTNTEPA